MCRAYMVAAAARRLPSSRAVSGSISRLVEGAVTVPGSGWSGIGGLGAVPGLGDRGGDEEWEGGWLGLGVAFKLGLFGGVPGLGAEAATRAGRTAGWVPGFRSSSVCLGAGLVWDRWVVGFPAWV